MYLAIINFSQSKILFTDTITKSRLSNCIVLNIDAISMTAYDINVNKFINIPPIYIAHYISLFSQATENRF